MKRRTCSAMATILLTAAAGTVAAQDCPDGACDPTAALDGVPRLNLRRGVLVWSEVAGAIGYDVVRGDVRTLVRTGGSYAEATTVCLGDDLPVTQLEDPEIPPPESGFWFLVRPVAAGGPGTYDTALASQVAPRDEGIEASGANCP